MSGFVQSMLVWCAAGTAPLTKKVNLVAKRARNRMLSFKEMSDVTGHIFNRFQATILTFHLAFPHPGGKPPKLTAMEDRKIALVYTAAILLIYCCYIAAFTV